MGDLVPSHSDPDDYTAEELAFFAGQDEINARRAAEAAEHERFDQLLDERGVSDEDLFRWTSELPDEMVQRLLERMNQARPVVATRARWGAARHALEVHEQVQQLRIRAEARRLHELESRPTPEPPELVSLSAFLDEPDDEVRYRVYGLWPVDGRIVLAAQNKSGKTTLVGNLIRSLVDGDDFLGRFAVEPVRRVVLIDNEMSEDQIRRWLRDQGIRKTDSVELISLRGVLSSFNILDPSVRAEWAQRIGPADALIFDCLRPALDALGLSEDKDAGRFLEALDELVVASGSSELLVVHHMGHTNERSRGDSRLQDWPDANWKLVKEVADDPTSNRYFSANGRDVDQGEVRLSFNPDDRHLSVDGGSRKAATASRIEDDVLLFVGGNPGCGLNEIKDGVDGDNGAKVRAVRAATARGDLVMIKVKQKHTHFLPFDAPTDHPNAVI